jgi:hypothetical integral membrane protein (TIGR02206 family)
MAPLRFDAFSPEHGLLVGIFLVGVVGFALVGRSLRGTERGTSFARGYAVLIPVVTVPMQTLQLLPGDFTLGTSLPLQICDLSWMVAVYALWTNSPRATALLYFWGLTLTIQGILTPSLGETFPDPRYFMFWAMHLLTVWAAVYLVCAVGGPRWADYRFTLVCTAVWAVTVMVFNGAAGTNYGYLNEKPEASSLLDVLGPWPAYVVVEIAVIAGVWALMTWPWARSRASHDTSKSTAGHRA